MQITIQVLKWICIYNPVQPNLLIKFLICLENSYEAYEWLHFLTKRVSKHYHKTILLLKYPKVQFKYAKYITAKIVLFMNEWMKDWLIEWMNEWMVHLYSTLLCIVVQPKRFKSCGGVSPQPPPVCSIHLDDPTTVTGQQRQCAHHTPATGGEERES